MVSIVDFVKMKITVPPENIKTSEWKNNSEKYGYDWYFANIGKVKLKYSTLYQNLIIEGRIINFITKSYYLNFDDFEESKLAITQMRIKANESISNKLVKYNIDIFKAKLTQIEFSFNIETNYVKQYIDFLNLIYSQNKEKIFIRHKIYEEHSSNDSSGSFYLKTNADNEHNSLKNFCINIYNKAEQLENKRNNNISKYHKSFIKPKDVRAAENILRIECKAGYEYLKKICNDTKLERTLGNLLNEEIAKNAISHQLKRFFTDGDFYSKNAVEKIIADKKIKLDLDTPFSELSEYKSKRRKKVLTGLGICPYGFIPKEWDIEKLDNPIKLIHNKHQLLISE